MSDWTSSLGYALGYAIAAAILVVPIVLLVIVMNSAWLRRHRKRVRWAVPKMPWWRDPMSELGPFGVDPEIRERRRRD